MVASSGVGRWGCGVYREAGRALFFHLPPPTHTHSPMRRASSYSSVMGKSRMTAATGLGTKASSSCGGWVERTGERGGARRFFRSLHWDSEARSLRAPPPPTASLSLPTQHTRVLLLPHHTHPHAHFVQREHVAKRERRCVSAQTAREFCDHDRVGLQRQPVFGHECGCSGCGRWRRERERVARSREAFLFLCFVSKPADRRFGFHTQPCSLSLSLSLMRPQTPPTLQRNLRTPSGLD